MNRVAEVSGAVVVYPESDGKPMSDNTRQARWMVVLHGNLEALNACLRHARDRGAESFVFLGDLVGYGADACAVVEVVARYAAEGSVVLKGNHDEAVEKSGGYFNDASRAAIEWARQTLSQEQRRFLAKLPLVVRQRPAYLESIAEVAGAWHDDQFQRIAGFYIA